jgi:hypothetical protein
MVLVHLVNAKSGEPACGSPERTNWLWTAFIDEVTCASCWSLGRERRAHHRPEPAVATGEV